MSHIQIHAKDAQDVSAAIYGLADLLEREGSREGCEDEAQMMGGFHRGCLVTAIKHLAHRAGSLAETIQEQEARLDRSGR